MSKKCFRRMRRYYCNWKRLHGKLITFPPSVSLTALSSSAGRRAGSLPGGTRGPSGSRTWWGRRYLEKAQVSPSCSSLRAVHESSSSRMSHLQRPFLTWGPRGLQSLAEVVAEAGPQGCQQPIERLCFAEGLEMGAETGRQPQQDAGRHSPGRATKGQGGWGLQ